MSGIQINNEAAGQFSNLRRRTFGIECEFIGLTPKNISDPEDATKYACKMLQEKVDLPCKNKCQQGSHQWYLPVRDTVAQGKATTGYTFSAWEVQHDVSISLDDDEYETYLSVADRTDVAQVELVSHFTHIYLESVSESMSSYVDRLIEDQLADSSTTDWDPNHSPSYKPDLAPEEMEKEDEASQQGLSWDAVHTEGWEKVQPLQWPEATADEPPVEPWGQSPDDSWGKAADDTWAQQATITGSQQQNDDGAWDTPVYPSRVPIDPAKAARIIRKLLLSYNIPTWLKQIKAMETLDDIKQVGTPHKSAVNFEHLDIPLAGITKNTIEVRMHAGSLCPVEIISWIDLLGSLTQHIEARGMQSWFTHCSIMYAQPNYTLVDLCRWIGCARSTISHYKDVISSPDYAERRHKRYTTGDFNPKDHLFPLTLNIEDNRLKAFSRDSISQRTRQKLQSGRYGQFPLSYLQAYIPEASSHTHAVGALDIDSKQQEGY